MRPGCTLTHTDYSPIQSLAAVFNLKQIMHCVQPKNAQLYERTCMRVCVRGCERVCAYCAACACIHLCVCSYIRVCVWETCVWWASGCPTIPTRCLRQVKLDCLSALPRASPPCRQAHTDPSPWNQTGHAQPHPWHVKSHPLNVHVAC